MTLEELHNRSNQRLLSLLSKEDLGRVFDSDLCDIDPDFLGFVGIYERLSDIIPTDWTVVDLGCAYAPQSAFFRGHQEYIGVDIMTPISSRFGGANVRHFEMPSADFIKAHISSFDNDTTFAICSYVPPWHKDSMGVARASFKNCFTFYPASKRVEAQL